MKYREIKEADPKTKTKTKTKTKPTLDFDLQYPTSQGDLTKYEPKTKNVSKAKVDTTTVSKDKTVSMQPQLDPTASTDIMRSFMNKTADVTDPVDVDSTFQPEPTEPTTMPALISREVALDQYNINWHDVKNLPGYAVQQIRGAFRPLFKNILGAELEEVTVATTIDPENSKKNMKRLIGYIGKHGKKLDDFNLEAFDIDPEKYKITKALVYTLGNTTFFVIEERMMGEKNYYIYAGPEKEDFDKVTQR